MGEVDPRTVDYLSANHQCSRNPAVALVLPDLPPGNLRNKTRMDAEEKTNLGNCPHCTNIIFKDGVFNSEATFSMRCPHCNKNLKVIVKTKIEIIILPAHNEVAKKKGPGLMAVILILYLPPVLHQLGELDNLLDIFT